MIIAIDGPAASGKGTIAQRLAARYGLPHLDTGLLYRATAAALIAADRDLYDEKAAVAAARGLALMDFEEPLLRGRQMGEAASVVAAMPGVREALLDAQRAFAARPEGAVLDGRDIGTVICPEAEAKLFITATPEARAARRTRELQDRGEPAIYEAVLQDMKDRDARDSQRRTAPLVPADDAFVLDTTELDADAAFAAALGFISRKLAARPSS
jgi:CMP/dCMP kinase